MHEKLCPGFKPDPPVMLIPNDFDIYINGELFGTLVQVASNAPMESLRAEMGQIIAKGRDNQLVVLDWRASKN